MIRRLVWLAATVAISVGGATANLAQQPVPGTSTISGAVVDRSDAVVAGATVRAVLVSNEAVSAMTVTDVDGRFLLTGLRPGRYRVTAFFEGFATATQHVATVPGMLGRVRLVLGSSESIVRPGVTLPTAIPEAPPEANNPSGGSGPPVGAIPPPAAPPDGSAVVSVFYATDRVRLPGPVVSYGAGRNATGVLDLGRFEVSVPRDHERGSLERPDVWTFWKPDPALHFLITRRTRQSYNDFYADIRDRVARFARKDAFVFIHGFNVTFDDAVYRAAQFAYDLQVPIAPILYSWPSAEVLSPIGYATDAESNRWSERHLRWFLEDVVARTGAERVHLIAHSMGNKALLNALDMMAPSTTRKFGQIILTAPDVDADQFAQLANAVSRSGERTTLYASTNDIALSASKRYQGGYRRAGDANGGVIVVPGIDTIDVSALKTDFLGHSPQGNGSVISDIFLLLTQGLAPGGRPGLRRAGGPASLFWRFVP